MWFIGALLGGLLFAAMWPDGWLLGAILGAVAGVWFNRRQGVESPDKPDRVLKLEQQLSVLADEMRQVRQRLAALEQGKTTEERPAAASVAPEAEFETQALAPDAGIVEPVMPVPAFVPTLVPVAAADPGDLPPAPTQPARAASGRSASTADRYQPPAIPSRIVEWLMGGNLVARIGVVILFFGVAFLLKHAYETYDLPIELRLTGVALGAVALLIVGWRLRESRAGYALALQGGGVGLLYLTIFAAFRLYSLLPALPAFALLFGVAALAAMLAVLQDALVLAVLGAAGGFLAPILASTGDGSHVMLFGYYAVLNAGILAIAWFKAWRVLNLTGFVFTFAIAGMWVSSAYQPEQFATTEPFLALFFLIYVAIAVLFARRGSGDRNARAMDGTLLFGVPLLGFAMQLKLVEAFEYGAAWSALTLGLFYLLLTRYLLRREGTNLMPQAFLAIGVVFATLAIPLAFDDRWTSAAWALEGAGILWVGVRQQRFAAWSFGGVLQILAGLFYLSDFESAVGVMPLLNSIFLGALLLSLSGLFCAWMLDRKTATDDARGFAIRHLAGLALFAWGVVWWAAAGLNEIDQHVELDFRTHAALLFAAASCLGFSWLARRLDWAVARIPALALLPLMVLAGLDELDRSASRPFAHLGWLAWPAAFAAHWWLLRRHEDTNRSILEWMHAGGLWLLAGLGAWQVAWMIDDWVAGQAVWPLIAWALVPGALLALSTAPAARQRWPLVAWPNAYLGWGAMPLAASLVIWFLSATLGSDANPAPLPYVPLLNPLDLAQAGVLLVLVAWFADTRRLGLMPMAGMPLANAWAGLGIGGFVWANAVLLRTLHHYAAVPLRIDLLLASDLVQASLSLFWSLIALIAMVLATRRGWRGLWMVGAGLMFVVVLKLLLVDLSNVGTIERIVSFVGVGLLMLVVGYFAPAPPKAIDTKDAL